MIELRPGHSGFEKTLAVGYAIAADGKVLRDGTPRNPFHTAVLMKWGDIHAAGVYRFLVGPLTALAAIARLLGVDRRLEERYLAEPAISAKTRD